MGDRSWEAFDEVAALVIVLDREGRIVAFNRACEKLTGFSAAEMLGRSLWDDLILPEEVVPTSQVFGRLRAGDFPNEFENYWLTKTKERRWIAWSNTARVDARGEVEFIIATGVDISERKRMDDDLRRSEQRFRILVDRVPDYAIFMLDPEGRVASWNAGAQAMTGYSAEEIVGRPLATYYTPEDIAARKPQAALDAAAQRGHVFDTGWRVRKDGSRFHADVSITALRTADGSLRGYAKVTRDATARWKGQQRERLFDRVTDVLGHALPDYDETLAAVARLAVDWFADVCTIARLDEASGTKRVAVTYSDPALATVAEKLRTMPSDRTHPVIMPRVIATRKAELHTIESYLADEAKLHPDYAETIREMGPRSIVIAPLVSRGRALGLLTIGRTRSSDYDDDDVRLAQDLGERAGLHIDNARLYRRAQQALQARDDVMSILAHDLRNPLNTIGLQAQLMLRGIGKDGGAPESIREAATDIKTSVTKMDHLIGDLFEAARNDAGGLVRAMAPCSATQLATSAVESARALAASKGLTLGADVAPELPAVKADPERIHQVLSNLLGNAIKFTPAGGTITVKVEPGDDVVVFRVADTGPGIAPEDLPRVFDRFFQGRRADKRGAGLGLWICNGIVESHGGSLSVESALGKGSTFRFTLPVAR